jgi:hypothetical protein
MQIKTTIWYHFTDNRVGKIKTTLARSSVSKKVKQLELYKLLVLIKNDIVTLENNLASCYKVKWTTLIELSNPLLNIFMG